jgi:NAD(P)-dependent dehydrogenase (short-subunit alcohol dehydrogenase family)
MERIFEGQVALITGAAMGIGLAAAEAFTRAGAVVVLADINVDAARRESERLNAAGYHTAALCCDVAEEGQVAAMVDETMRAFGRVDMAFNNAGIQIPLIGVADLSSSEYDRIMNVNLRGVWLCMKYELLRMREQGNGAIVNNSSIGGIIGIPGGAAYQATKHGVIGLTKSTALEYAAKNIRINAICPGTIDTPMVQTMFTSGELVLEDLARLQPIGRLGKAAEVADTVLWLCGPTSSFIIGQALPVDGGYTVQ